MDSAIPPLNNWDQKDNQFPTEKYHKLTCPNYRSAEYLQSMVAFINKQLSLT